LCDAVPRNRFRGLGIRRVNVAAWIHDERDAGAVVFKRQLIVVLVVPESIVPTMPFVASR